MTGIQIETKRQSNIYPDAGMTVPDNIKGLIDRIDDAIPGSICLLLTERPWHSAHELYDAVFNFDSSGISEATIKGDDGKGYHFALRGSARRSALSAAFEILGVNGGIEEATAAGFVKLAPFQYARPIREPESLAQVSAPENRDK